MGRSKGWVVMIEPRMYVKKCFSDLVVKYGSIFGKDKTMTDKQIIIDGIDVGGCIYYEDGKCLNGEMVQCSCKKVAVCYYKEYKRKEQECEELKNEYWKLEQGNDFLAEKNSKLKGCLTEIKEIAEECIKTNDSTYNPSIQVTARAILSEEILNKISEVEDD